MRFLARTYPLVLVALAAASSSHADSPVVDMSSSGSEKFGALQESASGNELLLRRGNGEPIVVGSCSDERAGEPTALSGGGQAFVVYRNCGATVEFATQVVLARDDQQSVVAVLRGRQPVRVGSSASSSLSVRIPALPSEAVFRKEIRSQGLAISYGEDPTLSPAPESEYLDFSSFNYGATGRAAGMPAELLLRLAGWSQHASGLSRPEWGRWSDRPPYGDDPRGSEQVSNGIAYFDSKQH